MCILAAQECTLHASGDEMRSLRIIAPIAITLKKEQDGFIPKRLKLLSGPFALDAKDIS